MPNCNLEIGRATPPSNQNFQNKKLKQERERSSFNLREKAVGRNCCNNNFAHYFCPPNSSLSIFNLLWFNIVLVILIQGFNSTLTEPVDTPERRGDQIREMDLKLHPDLKEPLTAICNDPNTTVVILSGSDTTVLDDVLCFFELHVLFLLFTPILSTYFLTQCLHRTLGSIICG